MYALLGYKIQAGLQLAITKKISPGPTVYYNSGSGMTEKTSVICLKAGSYYTILYTPSVGYSHQETFILSEIYFQVQYRIDLSEIELACRFTETFPLVKAEVENRTPAKRPQFPELHAWPYRGPGLAFWDCSRL